MWKQGKVGSFDTVAGNSTPLWRTHRSCSFARQLPPWCDPEATQVVTIP
jgi:hypothetical protein